MNKMILRTVPALLLLAFSGAASAAAFQLWEQNASGLGNAYAGSAAVADNASTVYFNPAGMTQLNGIQLSVGVTGVGPSYEYRDQTGIKSGGDAGSWRAVPNAYLSYRLTQDLSAGFGISAPFGLATEYDSVWGPAGAGSALAIKSDIKTINFNPAIAYRISDKASLGFGLNYQKIDAELTNSLLRLKGDDSAWGWNAGALFTLSPAMRVGVSYRSAMKYTLSGEASGVLNGPIKADLKLPDTFILSVWQQVSDRWEAMGDLSYTRWNSLKALNVQSSASGALLTSEVFNYDNSWRFAWGAGYKATDSAKLKFGIAFDRTPVRDEYRTPRVPDNNRLWLSLGGQWNAGNYGKFDLGYSYIYVIDPTISQPGLQGKYDASAHVVGMQYSVGF
jgi:long-chain fatty acid transport protein